MIDRLQNPMLKRLTLLTTWAMLCLLLLLAPAQPGDAQGDVFEPLPTQTAPVAPTRALPDWLRDTMQASATQPPAYTATPLASATATTSVTATRTPTWVADVPSQLGWVFQTELPLPPAAPTSTPTPTQRDHYVLNRPIPIEDNRQHWVDRTYPYGSTQLGNREVHLGVEFVNARFTPVLAAAAGRVYYAGDDSERQFGPSLNYYGTLVVLEHDLFAADGRRIYTLYGHLQQSRVQTGQQVAVGERIGNVGDSGIAIGPHLHFEVRVGDPQAYRSTRNPELWLRPYVAHGTLAGLVTVEGALPTERIVLFVRNEALQRETYAYERDRAGDWQVNSSLAWGENFVLGDLPAGSYEVLVSTRYGRIRFRQQIQIEPERTTWLRVPLGPCPDDACY